MCVMKYNVSNLLSSDSAPHSAIEATQAYGIEEPPEEELQAQEVVGKRFI